MFNQALNINKPQDNQKSNEFTEEDYEQINKDISQALFDMKKDNQDQDENNNGEDNENEDNIDFFHRDFFLIVLIQYLLIIVIYLKNLLKVLMLK